jgi:hypothetical protein
MNGARERKWPSRENPDNEWATCHGDWGGQLSDVRDGWVTSRDQVWGWMMRERRAAVHSDSISTVPCWPEA